MDNTDNIEKNIYNYISSVVQESVKKINFIGEKNDYELSQKNILELINIYFNLEDEKERQIYGAQLIYSLRKFLVEQEIYFNFASPTLQKNAIYNQREVLRNLSYQKEGIAVLTEKLENEITNINNQDLRKENLKILLNQVLDMYEKKEGIYKKRQRPIYGIELQERKVYQSQIDDKNIYYIWRTQRKRDIKAKYYLKDGKYILLDRGWLWQWLQAFYYSNEYQDKKDSIDFNHDISPIIDKRENILGTKQGDFQIGTQWIQAKMDNKIIISHKNIKRVLEELKQLLSTNSQEKDEEEVKKFFNKNFLPEPLEQASKDSYKPLRKLIENLGKNKN